MTPSEQKTIPHISTYQKRLNVLDGRLHRAGLTRCVDGWIRMNGDCLFDSLADQLIVAGLEVLRKPWLRGGREELSKTLRQRAVACVNKKDDKTSFNAEGVPLSMFVTPNVEQWTKRMSRPGHWGDHVCLQAIANLYGCNIVVYSSIQSWDEKGQRFVPATTCNNNRLPTLTLGHIHEVHYETVHRPTTAAVVASIFYSRRMISTSDNDDEDDEYMDPPGKRRR